MDSARDGIEGAPSNFFILRSIDCRKYNTNPVRQLADGIVDCCLSFDQLSEYFWVLHGDFSEDLAIELDVALFQAVHELRIDCSVQTSSGVDTHLLKSTIVALLELTTDVGVATGFGRSRLSECDFGFASPHHALGTGKNILSTFDAVCTALNTRHRRLFEIGQRLDGAHIHLGDREVTALVARHRTGFTAVEMALATLALEQLARLGDGHAFTEGLGCLLFHKMRLGFASHDRGDIATGTGDWLFNEELVFLGELVEVFLDALSGDIAVLFLAST